jgi:hypothetical protein
MYKKYCNRPIRVAVLILQFIFGAIFAIIHILTAWQAVCLAHEAQNWFPRGEMVSLASAAQIEGLGSDVDYSLHLHCIGEKKHEVCSFLISYAQSHPIIWLEHGLGGQAMDFDHYQRNLSSMARVCAYDHAGLGWSEIPVF